MRLISTTIKKKHTDKILSGEKTREYKFASPFWNKRLLSLQAITNEKIGIVFLCGRKVYRFKVKFVHRIWNPEGKEIDGWWRKLYWEIDLGERIE